MNIKASHEADCYGDGNVYRGQRGKASAVKTIVVSDVFTGEQQVKIADFMTPSKSGFEEDPLYVKPCNSPSHNPPMHMVIPEGKIYRHVCPSCGYERVLRPPHSVMWSMQS